MAVLIVLVTVAGCAGPARAATYQVPDSVPADCSSDVTGPILAWIASVPDNSVLSFGTSKCYRIEGTLEISKRQGLDFEGNGSTFRSFDPPSDQHAVWRVWDSSGVVFRDMTIAGSYANGGTFDPPVQHAHAIDLRGTNATITNVAMRDVGGDCVYFGLGATTALARSSGSVLDSSCTSIGRNAISVSAGDGILVQHVIATGIGYDVFDVEPNIGKGWGSQSVTFDSNMIGTYQHSAYSIVENEPIAAQAFTNNRVVGRGLKITVGQSATATTSYPVSGLTITGNSATGAQAPTAMNLSLVRGLTVTNNLVPLAGGAMATIDLSCSIAVSNNAFPGGAVQVRFDHPMCAPSSEGFTTNARHRHDGGHRHRRHLGHHSRRLGHRRHHR